MASSYDSFLIFGANCDESSPVAKKYVRSLLPQLAQLERANYEFDCIKYRFKLEELLAMVAGELTISPKYFSPFANVSSMMVQWFNGSFISFISHYLHKVNIGKKYSYIIHDYKIK